MIALCAIPVCAGPGYPGLLLQIDGNPGERVPCMEAGIWANPNLQFEALPGQTAGYFYDEGTTDRWSIEFFQNPWPSGEFQWTGHYETGSSDLRTTHNFSWFRNSGPLTDPQYDWWLIVYAVDTRHQVAYLEINPDDLSYGSFTAPVSRGGYDVIVAATPLASVPEPGSMLAMFSGLVGLVGFGTRRRRNK